jgi:hypothetical protein
LAEEPKTTAQTALERLSDSKVRATIVDIFRHYYEDLQPILIIATAEASGTRPEGLSNEIYACFHHVARALCQADANVTSELNSAQKSHLKRAILDSYKIAIHSHLAELDEAKKLLDYMVLVKDFAHYFPRGVERAAEVKALGVQVKSSYLAARTAEATGDFELAIGKFNSALDLCGTLREKLNVFTSDQTYMFACEREAERKASQARERRISIWVPIGCTIITAILTAFLTAYLTKKSSGQTAMPLQQATVVQPALVAPTVAQPIAAHGVPQAPATPAK